MAATTAAEYLFMSVFRLALFIVSEVFGLDCVCCVIVVFVVVEVVVVVVVIVGFSITVVVV